MVLWTSDREIPMMHSAVEIPLQGLSLQVSGTVAYHIPSRTVWPLWDSTDSSPELGLLPVGLWASIKGIGRASSLHAQTTGGVAGGVARGVVGRGWGVGLGCGKVQPYTVAQQHKSSCSATSAISGHGGGRWLVS